MTLSILISVVVMLSVLCFTGGLLLTAPRQKRVGSP